MSIHAKHDKKLLEKPSGDGSESIKSNLIPSPVEPESQSQTAPSSMGSKMKTTLSSDVCCEDVDSLQQSSCIPSTRGPFVRTASGPKGYRPPLPPKFNLSLKIGILTISDRAAAGEYETGDLSGPAVEKSLTSNIGKLNSRRAQTDPTTAIIKFITKAIVPDDVD